MRPDGLVRRGPTIQIRDVGELCTLTDRPPGPFRMGALLGFESALPSIVVREKPSSRYLEAMYTNRSSVYVVPSGEPWAPTLSASARKVQIVQPCEVMVVGSTEAP